MKPIIGILAEMDNEQTALSKNALKEHVYSWWAAVLSSLLILLTSCGQNTTIPRGRYAMTPENVHYCVLTEEEHAEFYWQIVGDKARCYISNALTYKCDIVEEDGKIYFNGYTWKSLFSDVTCGDVFSYEVVYDGEEKSITILWEE